jgi:hypothetical protein
LLDEHFEHPVGMFSVVADVMGMDSTQGHIGGRRVSLMNSVARQQRCL